MALNKHMHPRNKYKDNPPDFSELSQQYPDFERYVKRGANQKFFINFRNPSAVRTLTKCLLHKDFGLDVFLPEDRLSPTIPSRLNYILWIEDLLKATSSKSKFSEQKHVVDIGTGSSCIYPLLGVKNNPHWKFTATEIDDLNYETAVSNVQKNSLQSSINVVKVDKKDAAFVLLHLFRDSDVNYDICMCNPPFYTDIIEKDSKGGPVANSSCHADNVESITDGGDFAFALKLFKESLELREKLNWYTIMMGKKSSFVSFKRYISNHSEALITSYEFCQGRTIRWGVAWTFCTDLVKKSKLSQSLLQIEAKTSKTLKPIKFTLLESVDLVTVYNSLVRELDELNIDFVEISKASDKIVLSLSAEHYTWVGVRRQSRKRKHDEIRDLKVNGSSDRESGIEKSELGINENGIVFPTRDISNNFNPILKCEVVICSVSSNRISLKFNTENQNQKVATNGLVVYLKRKLSKT